MKYQLFVLVMSVVACGGGTPEPAAVEPSTEGAVSKCEPKPALAATAKATPKVLVCDDKEKLPAATDACNGGDPAQCYVVGSCFAMQILMIGDKDPVQRAKAIEMGKKAMRVACDGGIADGCYSRAGMIENQTTNRRAREEACEDVIRACHLGKQAGCMSCLACGS